MCVTMQNFVKIGQVVLEISQFFDFMMAANRPSTILDCVVHIVIIHKEYLEVYITLQNMVGMAAVVSIIQKFEYFAHLA